jgi:hypothetical protein
MFPLFRNCSFGNIYFLLKSNRSRFLPFTSKHLLECCTFVGRSAYLGRERDKKHFLWRYDFFVLQSKPDKEAGGLFFAIMEKSTNEKECVSPCCLSSLVQKYWSASGLPDGLCILTPNKPILVYLGIFVMGNFGAFRGHLVFYCSFGIFPHFGLL